MWNRLKGLARGGRAGRSPDRARESGCGNTVIAIETTREVLTPERLDQIFYAELLGVRSCIDSVNPLERLVMKRVGRLSGKSADFRGLVPPVHSVVPALMRSLCDDRLSDEQLAAEISRDRVLLDNVLRFANSAFYRTPEAVRDIQHAVGMLGGDGVRSLVARAVFRPLLNGYTDHFSKLAGPLLWQQGERCAQACECIASRAGIPVFNAFVAGLIHKVGYRVVARVLGEEYKGGDAPRSAAFRDWLIERVPILSWRVSQEWGLPDSVTQSLAGLARAQARGEFARLSGVVLMGAAMSEFSVLSRTGRIRGELKRLTCHIEGDSANHCADCYAWLSSLDPPA